MRFSIVEDAFAFVSMAPQCQNSALISRTGDTCYMHSDFGDFDSIPEDVFEDPDFVEVPHKNDLDLGQALVREFVARTCPHLSETVAAIFRRRGAYRQFKDLLEEADVLDKWYEFEAQRTREALLAWCAENDIRLEDD